MSRGRVGGWVTGWRVPLRIARRDARRARGRTALALTLLALPVLAVTTADTLYATSSVTGAESLERRLGAAEARIDLHGTGQAFQTADPDEASQWSGGGAPDRAAVAAVLGLEDLDAQSVPLREGSVRFETDRGRDDAQVLVTDLGDPLTDGLVRLTEGRLPTSTDEVVVNARVDARGPGVGEDLVLASGDALRIVGEAESAAIVGRPFAAALPGAALEPRGASSLLVGGDPVSWAQVRELNDLAATVVSRAVLVDPPPDSALAPEVRTGMGLVDDAAITAAVLIAVMVLIEVVLLAGPAFAVGARRQARTLALVSAAGGSPRDSRRVVLGSGVVLGVGGSVIGVLVGLAAAWALRPVLQGYSTSRLGPYDVEPLHLAAVMVFGLVSALLAAAVPAWLASRQDVVAVLAGRRGDATPSRRSPVVGLVLVALGAGLATYGARADQGGENAIAVAAIVCVLGMLLLVPVVVGAVARASRGLPLALRFAARDAARHRTRTVPAVAAVAATVAGVVALGIATSSDEAQSAAGYVAALPVGDAAVSLGYGPEGRAADAAEVRATLLSALPAEAAGRVEEVRGVVADGFLELRAPGAGILLSSTNGVLAGDLLVSEAGLPSYLRGVEDLSTEQQAQVDEVLAAGGVVALSDTGAADVDEVRVVDYPARRGDAERTTLPAVAVPVTAGEANVHGVISPAGARAAGLEPATTALVVRGGLSAEEAQDAKEAVAGLPGPASLYVERGYQPPEEVRILQLVLGGLGAVLMLGGTLTATFLALSDARPDLATLGAVGAAPRTRRAVAAAYALVVGAVGSVLGALVGLVPGIAVTYPLTRPIDYGFGTTGPAHYLDVPWVLLGVVVVGLPLLSALVVAVASRSRLPLVARLE
ncbi:FtsX-like permease family protein [Nocardioides sp. AX2bis]|uniref:FtsX-like permease family protein n=1 Tax=Nocardioides sp. AX2bis TaxID=2653157 RepID=UPI0012F09CEA|nr:FtsX-like permease family protein [Nocardioides sp. AX2bis]VXB94676.1 FtsX-like permease family protein [Nocardioides sp. AX2bis]